MTRGWSLRMAGDISEDEVDEDVAAGHEHLIPLPEVLTTLLSACLIQLEEKRSSSVRRFFGSTVKSPRTNCLAAELTYFHGQQIELPLDESKRNSPDLIRFMMANAESSFGR